MKPVFVEAIGLAAPGLPGWDAARPVLAGQAPWTAQEEPPYQPELLPPNERRRAPPAVRLAFRVGEDLRARTAFDLAQLPAVFASSDADMNIIHRICSALTQPEPLVSPTDFHNSVHNAASGYWSIGIGARSPSTTVAGHDGSFAVGLLEAATWLADDVPAVLLIAFDLPPPPPLWAKRPIRSAAGVALVLTAQPAPGAPGAPGLSLALQAPAETPLEDAALETLRSGNPALRALPLLSLLARGASGGVDLPYSDAASLHVRVQAA